MAKKKFILTLALAIAASVWTMSKAVCAIQAPKDLYQVFTTKSGELDYIGYPCEEGMDCPDCLTVALITENNEVYYLTGLNEEQQQMIDKALYGLQNTMWPPKPVKAIVSGTPYQNGSFDFIKVLDIVFETEKLHSLCDTWNVWYESFESFGPISFDKVVKYQLTTDTLINGQQYVKLTSDKDSPYLGAMREGNNRDIYYIPADSTHEYLLYAFNAQVGDTLSNLWVGGFGRDYQGVVQAISNGSPRIFTFGVKFGDESDDYLYPIRWIEGVGSPETPMGMAVVPDVPADIGVYTLLCAYKNGEQIYVSEMGAEYGCEHDQTPEPTDTIPLYSHTGDEPGSSTVDPVDPNQVVATLQGNELTIRENMGVDITYSLNHNTPAQTPAQKRAPQSNTFRNEVTITITDSGEYLLQLTNPSWGYTIFGRFTYVAEGTERVEPASVPQKTLINGQIYILRGDKTYTITGQEMR